MYPREKESNNKKTSIGETSRLVCVFIGYSYLQPTDIFLGVVIKYTLDIM